MRITVYDANGVAKASGVTAVTFTATPTSAFDASTSISGGIAAITLSMDNQTGNVVFASPSDGSSATPAFRVLVAADIPNLAASKITSGTLAQARGGLNTDVSALSGLLKNTAGTASAVTAPSGAIVGDTDTQNLSNKTIINGVLNTSVSGTAVDDDATFASPSSTKVPTTNAVKGYVDQTVLGLAAKADVRLATAAALASVTYANGSSGVGATLTAVGTGVLTIDGVTVALNDRLLIKDQASGLQNGIYKCTLAGAIGVAFILTRTTDGDTDTELRGGWMFSTEGTANAGQGWLNTNTSAITFGTTAITFGEFSAGVIAAGTGLSKSGNTISLSSPVSAANGGTGIASPTAHSLLAANGASAVNLIAPGSSGQILVSNGTDWAAGVETLGTIVAHTVTGSSVANIDITSIPATYYGLLLVLDIRTDSAGANFDDVNVKVNNDGTAGNYNSYGVTETGSTPTLAVTSNAGASAFWALRRVAAGASATAGYRGQLQIFIWDYASTARMRNMNYQGANLQLSNVANMSTVRGGGNYVSTGTAINRLTLTPGVGSNFTSITSYALYGIGAV